MTATDLFNSYWWLIFPIFGMGMGLVAMLGHFRHRSETLKLIKTYADQGKEPPAALLEALRSDEDRAYNCRGGRRSHWSQVVVFGALAAAFGYFGYYGEGGSIFISLAIGFGIATAALLVISIIRALTGASLPKG
ncbi:hypothetical protein [Asticcacaulis sp.]|jgi:hypothetical protein|uniref:hypothetical protein n=1 Tax=Asticcacaulis sp. TaxID=1872648 RepID=UPI003F7C4412